ncbi:related to cystathionine beta-lyases/cystathionine gamma-synthases [Rhynchosporium agropyri]|uniref:Related to cystathionine beta-lyases/cystathionine gamma-synthases n=1 Tax=Rhynchosporium agropyri TaxID=914238 RepID=A0A1E1KWV6_9HELO|nr:related to cystathionine beta-lyases/cystathionine gamma-synthases [Rhynchosporium agropyri]
MSFSTRVQDVSPMLPPKRLEVQPFGTAYVYPLDSKHGVSISLPTWDSTIAYFEELEEWKNEHIEWCYPRFFINRPIRELADTAFKKLNIATDGGTACLLFPTVTFARDCAKYIAKEKPDVIIDIVQFKTPRNCARSAAQILSIASFAIAVFPKEVEFPAMMFWMNVGGGLTTRHAVFAKDYIDYLEPISSNQKTEIQPPQAITTLPTPSWVHDIALTAMHVKSAIASLSTSENSSLPVITADHVTLYPTGMSAIYHASQALQAVATTSTVVAFGWMYDETIHNLKHGPWEKFIGYKRGTEQDLEHLTDSLKAGERIGALFCELPSNIFLSSVPLQRLRALSDEYGFTLACDDTVAGLINLDLVPYVDVILTSLTKMFSGASDVTGGSVIINPASRYYNTVHSALQARYQPAFVFPLDTKALRHNCQHVRWRAQRCNENALSVAQMLHGHPLIKRLNYPYFDESLPVYQSLMREGGGYGCVMGVIFHDENVAHRFYDMLNVPKGSSFGTNFTIAVPFALLVHYYNRDRVAAHGLPEHIIRISVGLENVEDIKAAIQTALAECYEGTEGTQRESKL